MTYLGTKNQEGEVWDTINQFNLAIFLCLSQVRTWISNFMYHGLFSMSNELRWEVIVLFYWYWWNFVVDHHCLNVHNMLRLVKKGWHFTKQLLWLLYVCDGKMLLFCAIIIIFIKISFDYITEKGGMWCPKLSFHLTNHHHI